MQLSWILFMIIQLILLLKIVYQFKARLIIFKNVEILFDTSSNEKETIVKDRYICDLVQELSVILSSNNLLLTVSCLLIT